MILWLVGPRWGRGLSITAWDTCGVCPHSKGCRDISWLFAGSVLAVWGFLWQDMSFRVTEFVKSYLALVRDTCIERQDVVSWRHLQRNASQSSDLISLSKLIISMLYCSFHSPAFTLRTSVCFSDREIFPGSSSRRHFRLWQKAPASLPLLVCLMEMSDETGFGLNHCTNNVTN